MGQAPALERRPRDSGGVGAGGSGAASVLATSPEATDGAGCRDDDETFRGIARELVGTSKSGSARGWLTLLSILGRRSAPTGGTTSIREDNRTRARDTSRRHQRWDPGLPIGRPVGSHLCRALSPAGSGRSTRFALQATGSDGSMLSMSLVNIFTATLLMDFSSQFHVVECH